MHILFDGSPNWEMDHVGQWTFNTENRQIYVCTLFATKLVRFKIEEEDMRFEHFMGTGISVR